MKRNLKINFFSIIGIVLLLAFSCSPRKTDSLETHYYADGGIDSVVPRRNDTIHGIIKRFYRNGKVKEERPYIMGYLEGVRRGYYENGEIEYEISYKNNNLHGLSAHYTEDGMIELELNFLNGREFGSAKGFYENGKIEKYNCFDFDSHNRYLIKYDSTGEITREEGSVLGQLLLDSEFTFDSIPLNTEVTMIISVATPPNRNVTVFVRVGEDRNLVILKINENMAYFKNIFKKKGNYKVISIGKMTDLQGNLIKCDSIETDIEVK